jgi:hypothetical protein
VLVVAIVILGPPVAPALGQTPDKAVVAPAGESEVFNPDASKPLPETTPDATPSDQVIDTEDAATTKGEEPQTADETVQQPGWGNARDQKPAVRRKEADTACQGTPPPTSRMLGFPGSVGASEGDPLGRLILIVAVGALLVAGVAYLMRQRGKETQRGPLESVAAIIGILGVIAGLAVQLVPGVGVRERPPPAVSMEVSDITPRITQAEYAEKTHSRRRGGVDGREVGNVIWLEIHLEGYRDKPLTLQYASFDPGANHALLPGTAITTPIPHHDVDVETQFVPIWVGYPLSEKFEAAFRLLDGQRVQALAETSAMKASKYRYSCKR